jgi:hypothetical protein
MDKNLLKKYREYASSSEACAVLFIKQNLSQSKGHWIDIVSCKPDYLSDDKFHFCSIKGGIYKRKIKPEYPPKSEFTSNGKFDDRSYYFAVRAITWATAHEDIEQQKLAGVAARKFRVTGGSYNKNEDQKGYFKNDTPSEIKALANNLLDKTNPLWDIAMAYINEPEFIYKIKSIEVD